MRSSRKRPAEPATRLGDEQRAERSPQRPDGLTAAARVHGMPGHERLGRPERGAREGEQHGHGDGTPVPGGGAVERAQCRPGGPVLPLGVLSRDVGDTRAGCLKG
ncbi:hypothetical protein GCM10010340_13540 [Streptomyces griseoloalbus]|nr:hypothetical protein GCM10010340_13540 [Streptomyces albaduncus]